MNSDNVTTERRAAHNKNYMSIAVSVLTTSCVARNNSGAARQENHRCRQLHIVPSVMHKVHERQYN